MTYIQRHLLHQLVTAKDWKQAKYLTRVDWLINDNTSKPSNIMLSKNKDVLHVLIWKCIQDKSPCEKTKGRYIILN